MARINGRMVRASNLAERRILSSIGVHALRVPRGQNPFMVARKLRRAAKPDEDVQFLLAIAKRSAPKAPNGQSGAAAEAA